MSPGMQAGQPTVKVEGPPPGVASGRLDVPRVAIAVVATVIVVVGVGFAFAELPDLRPEAHDVAMDVVVSDAGVVLDRSEGVRR